MPPYETRIVTNVEAEDNLRPRLADEDDSVYRQEDDELWVLEDGPGSCGRAFFLFEKKTSDFVLNTVRVQADDLTLDRFGGLHGTVAVHRRSGDVFELARGNLRDVGWKVRFVDSIIGRIPNGAGVSFYVDMPVGEVRAWMLASGGVEAWARDVKARLRDELLEQLVEVVKSLERRSFGNFAGRSLQEVNAEELRAEGEPGPLPSLPVLGVGGIVMSGWSHILAGYPKAGKTELLTELCYAWRDAGVNVLYVTEEPRAVWQGRLALRDSGWDHMALVFARGTPPDEILERIKGGSEQVVIVDTIRSLVGIKDENDNAEVGRRLTPFVAACSDSDKTLILAHHLKKGGGEYGEGISGAHAFLGLVDVGLELRRVNPNAPSRRRLIGLGRVIAIPDLVFDRADDRSLRVLGVGGVDSFDFVTVKDRVLEVVTSEWAKTKDVMAALPEPQPSLDQVQKALAVLANDPESGVEREPPMAEGQKKGKTYKWRNLTSDT